MRKDIRRKIVVAVLWLVVFLWMFLIFNLSAQIAEQSNNLSKSITGFILEEVEKIIPGAVYDADIVNNFVRKAAHFTAYLFFGLLLVSALKVSGIRRARPSALALIICVIFAISDEVHQAFVPGRGPMVLDALLDSAGAFMGIGIYNFVVYYIKKRKT